MNDTRYCANCDNEATTVVTTEGDHYFFLCFTCGEAFEWGQARPGAVLESLDTWDDPAADALLNSKIMEDPLNFLWVDAKIDGLVDDPDYPEPPYVEPWEKEGYDEP